MKSDTKSNTRAIYIGTSAVNYVMVIAQTSEACRMYYYELYECFLNVADCTVSCK